MDKVIKEIKEQISPLYEEIVTDGDVKLFIQKVLVRIVFL